MPVNPLPRCHLPLLAIICSLLLPGLDNATAQIFIRANQLGYASSGTKLAMAFSKTPLPAEFSVLSGTDGAVLLRGRVQPVTSPGWGQFEYFAELDFSKLQKPGPCLITCGEATSLPFEIGSGPVRELPALLGFMRQQRCGYNPWLDAVCHPYDSRTAYGPLTNGTYLDARGGWHDAADQLKYLLTSGNATAQMLLAYQLGGERGSTPAHQLDAFNALGQPGANGIPDLLDEARWGLEWMLKLHPAPDQFYHQVADDRDHIGRRLPQNEVADYGWGKGSYRVVYFADGKPQGLAQYQSDSTGMANLAGRYAAAMGLAYQIWKDDPRHRAFAERCLQAGKEVYELGRASEGAQQGNSVKAPYRYEETTWADDMEWGAAELFRATGRREYLTQAARYARLAASESWMDKEQTLHYQFYPFMNLGHFRLYGVADRRLKKDLADYYRQGIEQCIRAGQKNPFRIGVPFIWCSNNLTTALATQCLLYELMTGDTRYREFGARQRDWLFGRNPWGYTMFTDLGAVSPKDPHLMTMQLTKRSVPGGLVDGPVYDRIFKSLKGVAITEPDPLALFQGPAVFHDDVQDYSTNEPTMDGTASAILLMVLLQN
ncbi:MAG TPA: glycoside hydrolase family 9 protein [Clostridia bacterium]|nr:glycoside hydrolase family 9 protein [Clostridia bacterium]